MNNFFTTQLDTIYRVKLDEKLKDINKTISIPIPSNPYFYLFAIFLLPLDQAKEYLIPYIFRGNNKNEMLSKSKWGKIQSKLLIEKLPYLLPLAYKELDTFKKSENIPKKKKSTFSNLSKNLNQFNQRLLSINSSFGSYSLIESEECPTLESDLLSFREQVSSVISGTNKYYEDVLIHLAKFKYTEIMAYTRVEEIMPAVNYLTGNYENIVNNPNKYLGQEQEKEQEYGQSFKQLVELLNKYYYF